MWRSGGSLIRSSRMRCVRPRACARSPNSLSSASSRSKAVTSIVKSSHCSEPRSTSHSDVASSGPSLSAPHSPSSLSVRSAIFSIARQAPLSGGMLCLAPHLVATASTKSSKSGFSLPASARNMAKSSAPPRLGFFCTHSPTRALSFSCSPWETLLNSGNVGSRRVRVRVVRYCSSEPRLRFSNISSSKHCASSLVAISGTTFANICRASRSPPLAYTVARLASSVCTALSSFTRAEQRRTTHSAVGRACWPTGRRPSSRHHH